MCVPKYFHSYTCIYSLIYMFIYIYFSIPSETTCSDIHIYVYISSMQTSYLTAAFHPIRSLSSLQLIWKIWNLLSYFIILSFLSCSPCLCRRPGFLLLDPNHSFYVHLGRAKDHPKWMTLKTSVKTWSQLRMASPAILWTQREGTLTMPSWQRMSGSPLSEGLLFCFPRKLNTCFCATAEHYKLSRTDHLFYFIILLS